MFKLIPYAGLAAYVVVAVSCSAKIDERTLDSAQVRDFESRADELRLSREPDSPLAGLMPPQNQIGAPLGMQIWLPDKTLSDIGIRSGDVIVDIAGQDMYATFEEPWHLTEGYFKPGEFNQGPLHLEVSKYVHFVEWLLEEVENRGSVMLTVHEQFLTREEIAANGRYAEQPHQVRISWQPGP